MAGTRYILLFSMLLVLDPEWNTYLISKEMEVEAYIGIMLEEVYLNFSIVSYDLCLSYATKIPEIRARSKVWVLPGVAHK